MLNGLLEFIPEIQIADATEAVTDWLTDTFSFIFDPINKHFGNFMEFVAEDVLLAIPPVIFIILVALINIIGSVPSIANSVVENRLLLIGWLHLLFLGLYVPFIWVLIKQNISALIWFIYGFMIVITEIILVFPAMINKWISIPIMLLLFFAYLGVFLCICLVHTQLLFEKKTRIKLNLKK